MNDIRVLCLGCYQNYLATGDYELILNGWQDEYSPCFMCGRNGLEYIMKDIRKDRHKTV